MDRRRRDGLGWVLSGAGLLLVGLAVVLYNLWPDIQFRAGLIHESSPYPSAFTQDGDGLAPGVTGKMPSTPRVVIPRIGVDVRIYEGDVDRALRRGVYHHAGTAAPGERGNMVIAGHRNRRQFALLSYLRPGDVVSIYWASTEYGYRVVRVHQVTAVATEILARGTDEMLTLYTCTPRFLGNKRTVVVAEPISPAPATSGAWSGAR